MPRTLMEVQKELDVFEGHLDRHLSHCATCDEGRERYCREGAEISVMVTRLLMEKMRLQVAGDSRGIAATEPGSVCEISDGAEHGGRGSS